MKLTKDIVTYILRNFGVKSTDTSLMSVSDHSFILPEKLYFEENDQKFEAPVYGCECVFQKQKLIVLYCCLETNEDSELFLYVKLENNPSYCIVNSERDSKIYFCMEKSDIWTECSMYLQFTFSAALESIKEIKPSFYKAQDYKKDYINFQKIIELKSNEQ